MPHTATIHFLCSVENPRTLPDRPLTTILDVQAFLPSDEPVVAGLTMFNGEGIQFSKDDVSFAYIVAKVDRAVPGHMSFPLTLMELAYNLVGDIIDCYPIYLDRIPATGSVDPERMLTFDHRPYMDISGIVDKRDLTLHEFNMTIVQWTRAQPDGTLPVVVRVPDTPKFKNSRDKMVAYPKSIVSVCGFLTEIVREESKDERVPGGPVQYVVVELDTVAFLGRTSDEDDSASSKKSPKKSPATDGLKWQFGSPSKKTRAVAANSSNSTGSKSGPGPSTAANQARRMQQQRNTQSGSTDREERRTQTGASKRTGTPSLQDGKGKKPERDVESEDD